jgi:hypothetical protein
MKVDYAESHVKGSHGLGPTKAFSIRTTGHAFKLLSSGLYSDKIAAVLREIGCNAADAHTQGGTPDRAIEVKLPNRIDPQFYIKDWGPGLSDEDVMDMYTTYFASSKQSTNDYTGAFGLGSKSPFSYTDSFTVTSVHGGRKRTYSAHLDNSGAPTIGRLSDEDADANWDHGLMVAFPVKPADFATFQDRANSIFRWFRVVPEVRGGARPARAEFTLDQTDFCRVTGAGCGVLMGNVHYPLAASQITGLIDGARGMFELGDVVLKVDIGDVNVAASRESLQYDKQSIAFLLKRCEDVSKHIADDIAANIRKTINAPWPDKCKLRDMKHGWTSGQRWFNWGSYFKVAGHSDFENLANVLTGNYQELPTTLGTTTLTRLLRPGNNGAARHSIIQDGNIRHSSRHSEKARLSFDANTVLYYGDAPHGLERVRQEVIHGRVKQALMIAKHPAKGVAGSVQAEVDDILHMFPGLPSVKVGSLPVPPTRMPGSLRVSRKTKAALPLPAMAVRIINGEGSKPTTDMLNAVPARNLHYMCRTPSWDNDYAGNAVRFYAQTIDQDRAMSRRVWDGIWGGFVKLQDELGVKVSDSYVAMTAAEIKSADIVKRRWKWTYTVIEEWVRDPATQAKIVAVASRWRPTIDLSPIKWQSSWVKTLAFLCGGEPDTWKLLKPMLAVSAIPGLDGMIEQLVAASKAAGNKAGRNQPPALMWFSLLNDGMSLDITLAMPPAGRQFTTPEQLDDLITEKIPMTEKFDTAALISMTKYPDAAKVAAFGQLLFN